VPELQTTRKEYILTIIGVVIMACVAVALVYHKSKGPDLPDLTPDEKIQASAVRRANEAEEVIAEEKSNAAVYCQLQVTHFLKAPSTAQFGSETVAPLGPHRWRVESYVDAENSFGARLRTRYRCEATYLGNENWKLTKLRTNE
jgi:hypothetical protein